MTVRPSLLAVCGCADFMEALELITLDVDEEYVLILTLFCIMANNCGLHVFLWKNRADEARRFYCVFHWSYNNKIRTARSTAGLGSAQEMWLEPLTWKDMNKTCVFNTNGKILDADFVGKYRAVPVHMMLQLPLNLYRLLVSVVDYGLAVSYWISAEDWRVL